MINLKLYYFGLFALLGLLLLSFTGRFFAIGDSFAVFRPLILMALVLWLILPPKIKWQWPGLLAVLLVLAATYRHGLAPITAVNPTYSVYQKNLFFRIKDVGPVAADIRSFKELDFVTLQEITNPQTGLMAELKVDFPYQHICPFSGVGGTAVLSRWPIIKSTRKCFGGGMTAAQADTPNGKIWVVSTHLNWPYPHSQAAQVEHLLPELTKLDGPIIIGGDFNMVPWSYTLRAFQAHSYTKRLPGTLTTFRLAKIHLGLPIDHILAPKSCTGKTRRREKLGSDHFGVYGLIACD